MIVHFYRYDAGPVPAPAEPLSGRLKIRCWRPDVDGLPPPGSRALRNYVWWAFAKLGLFARRGFSEVSIERDGRLLHRLVVTPAWYRFPFMSACDLQLGGLWTSADSRRQHLASAAIAEAHRRLGDRRTRFWFVTDADNLASAALARSCGYELAAVGKRTRRFGASLFGQYVIQRFV